MLTEDPKVCEDDLMDSEKKMELEKCPNCGGTPKLLHAEPLPYVYYQCPECGLDTGFMGQWKELAKLQWNQWVQYRKDHNDS